MFKVQRLICFSLCFFVLACSQDKQATGTSDGGGGNIESSRHAEIIDAVYKARQGLINRYNTTTPEIRRPDIRFRLFKVSETEDSQMVSETHAQILLDIFNPRFAYEKVFPEKFNLSPFTQLDYSHTQRHESMLDYALKIPVYFEAKKACPAPDKADADASVSSYNMDATVCFSLFKLARIPKESLELHLAGLWIHELVHMQGHVEQTATALQNIIVANYNDPDSWINKDYIKNSPVTDGSTMQKDSRAYRYFFDALMSIQTLKLLTQIPNAEMGVSVGGSKGDMAVANEDGGGSLNGGNHGQRISALLLGLFKDLKAIEELLVNIDNEGICHPKRGKVQNNDKLVNDLTSKVSRVETLASEIGLDIQELDITMTDWDLNRKILQNSNIVEKPSQDFKDKMSEFIETIRHLGDKYCAE